MALAVLAACSRQEAAEEAREALESTSEIVPSRAANPGPPPSRPLATSVASAPSALSVVAADAGCGRDQAPDCPLQGWMKSAMSVPLGARDFAGVEQALLRLATIAPQGYLTWPSIARDGADAARIEHVEAVRAACRGCHAQYRSRYRAELRQKPVF